VPTHADALWQRAASFAARAHAHQLRKDNATPYFAHPVRVAFTVRHVFGCDDEVALAAALLHDTIEDTTTDYDDLHERFGKGVADIVASLTKNMAMPEPERERDYDDRLARADWRARLIKLADQYDNLSDLWSSDQRPRVLERVRRAIAVATPLAAQNPEIARAIAALESLARAGPH